jgi:predicted nucleic acid-binding protein
VIVDSGFRVALVRRDDEQHPWAAALAGAFAAPWRTCEAVLSEAFFLAGTPARRAIAVMLRRGALVSDFSLAVDLAAVLAFMDKYADVPMSLADACLVRMSETLSDPVVLTTDSDFRIYRRHGRQVVPCLMP